MSTDWGAAREYFERTLAEGDPSECWAWPYSKGDGRGRLKDGSETVLAYALAWGRLNGELPEGQELRHLCSEGSGADGCWNPHHVTPGSRSENILDAVKAGRWLHGFQPTLTPGQRAQIQARRQAGERGRDLAIEYGVSESLVSMVFKGQR